MLFHAVRRFTFLCVLLAACSATAGNVTFPTATLDIKTQKETLHFTVEVASNLDQQMQGLMFRTSLEPLHGMIFIPQESRRVTFWMKNTLIPLDMVFVDEKGTITQIEENAVPKSLKHIPSKGEVRAVIEVAGGTASRYHIVPGDRVIYSLFQ